MKRSQFTDEQILAIVKEGEAGRKVADVLPVEGDKEHDVLPRLFLSQRRFRAESALPGRTISYAYEIVDATWSGFP